MMDTSVQAWFDELADEQRSLLTELRELVLAADEGIVEAIKWSQPCYSLNGLFCYLQKAKKHVVLGFQQGAHLAAPHSLLEGAGRDMRHIKVPLNGEIKRGPVSELLKAAAKFDARTQ